MTLQHPQIQKLVSNWEKLLRDKIGSEEVQLVAFLPNKADIPFNVIRDIVCDYTGVSFRKAIAKCRKKELTLTRHLIVYFTKIHTKLSLTTIANLLKKGDHTTIISSNRRITRLIESGDPIICDAVVKISEAIMETYKTKEHETQPGK